MAEGFLVENLKDLIQCNSDLFRDLEENVKNLCQELSVSNDFFKQYRERHADHENLENLVNETRQVVYEAEDAIDTYIAHSSRQRFRGRLSKALRVVDHALELRWLVKNLEAIREKLQRLYQMRETFASEATRIEERPKEGESRRKARMVEEDNVIGFDDEVEKVIDLLTIESEQLEVISIIGMFGLGKTTLAKKIFNDPRVEYEFYPRAFVHVSREYKRKEVFLNILSAFTPITAEMNMMSDEILAEIIREKLQVRKYLIIMDDVWSKEAWDDLKVVLPNNRCSKILITSRNTSVAWDANQMSDPLYLRFLNPEESQELLRRKVFGENSCPLDLLDYESCIIQKCNGLPLAIVVIAGILLNHQDRTCCWSKVADDIGNVDHEEYNVIIRLSFYHLPYHLKPCFLYLGVFHEDFEIPVWKLLLLWIAEGFVESDGNMSLEDTAEAYLEDLVERNLVMVGQRRLNGKIKTCCIHDALRDFCKEEAMKENLFREIKRFDEATMSSSYPSFDDYRRLCINTSVLDYVASKPSGKHVRSFLSFAQEETILPIEHISSIPKAFKLLRVLDVRSIILTRFPSELLYLVLLKYIAVSCHFKIIPEKMSNLRNLQTLIIETSSRTLEIKADIWKMAQLRHLYTNASTCLPKVKGKFSAENLQTITTVSPESCGKELFERTPKLKKLAICGNLGTVMEVNGQSSLFDSIVRLEFLENLKLLNDDLICSLPALPHEKMFPRSLKRLTLLNTLLDWKYMSTLGKLENLEVLKLKDNAFQGKLWQTEDGGFRRLRVLHIGSTNLVVWQAMASQFPMLSSLILRHCNNLEAIPQSLGDIPSLQNIDLYCTNMFVASSARKIQLLKLEVQARRWNSRNSGFRLSVYPPDQ